MLHIVSYGKSVVKYVKKYIYIYITLVGSRVFHSFVSKLKTIYEKLIRF
jgi:hypothetical protein